MEQAIAAVAQSCPQCSAPLTPTSLVCTRCQGLVHGARLEELAASARDHESKKELSAAHADWQAALELLPQDSSQAAWVRTKLAELYQAIREEAAKTEHAPAWTRKLGPFAPIVLVLLKGKALLSLLKFKFLLSFASFATIYWALYGVKFGLGFAVLVLVHELGHFIAVRRRGLSADLPMFIPGFGAYVRWTAQGVTADARAMVSLAGPLAGALGAVACGALWLTTQDRLWIALASFSAFINLMNLIPVWTLDGAQAMVAINRAGRIGIAIAAVLFAVFLSQPLVLFVAAGAVYRAFFDKGLTPDMPPSYGVTAYFVTLLAVLTYLASLAAQGAPGH